MPAKKAPYKDTEKVVINGRPYEYDAYYDRLQASDGEFKGHPEQPEMGENPTIPPAVLCPYCHAEDFKLSYGEWELKAHCTCGHVMTVYDG